MLDERRSRDAEALHDALTVSGPAVRVKPSRKTAELIAELSAALVNGCALTVTCKHEVNLAEAAAMLAMSTRQVRQALSYGLLDGHMNGADQHVHAASVRTFRTAERFRPSPKCRTSLAWTSDAATVEPDAVHLSRRGLSFAVSATRCRPVDEVDGGALYAGGCGCLNDATTQPGCGHLAVQRATRTLRPLTLNDEPGRKETHAKPGALTTPARYHSAGTVEESFNDR
ncbi:hypothetical protein [Hamadaea tsunoensis]|uniref:hypothetical protein n=1 Tax=Hamadaea tsunoensis TaxID=53368 RepID=UPI0012FB20B4|nr:hypothetical protein [Hamadaea tsunoensis]